MSLKFDENSDDNMLMHGIKSGDHKSFAILVRRHSNRFYACAYRICLDQYEAEDAVQDAFLKLWNSPVSWDENKGAKFTTWFTRIVMNASYDRLRKKKNHKGEEALSIISDDRMDQESQMQNDAESKNVEQALKELPDRQRAAITLCFYEGHTNKEAAEILDIGVKALESLLMRGKKALKDHLIRAGMIEEKKNYG